jgi:hypothetical protein
LAAEAYLDQDTIDMVRRREVFPLD